MSGCLEVINDLCLLFSAKLIQSLQFHDHIIIANKIRLIGSIQPLSLIVDRQFHLTSKGNTPAQKLSFQSLLINGLQKTATKNAMNFEGCAYYCIGLRITYIII